MPSLPKADRFWQYARKAPFYEVILFKMIESAIEREKEIKKYKRKARKYRILQSLTFGTVKSFRRRENLYLKRIKQLK
jgi:predicted GIY-YIG superfamily endonuclease